MVVGVRNSCGQCGMLAEQRRTRKNKLTCDGGTGDWRRSCWRDRSAIVCLWSDDRAFDGPHIEEAMVISGVDRKGRTDDGLGMRWERGEVVLWLEEW